MSRWYAPADTENSDEHICRECHLLTPLEELIRPCSHCRGDYKYVHPHCLNKRRVDKPQNVYECHLCKDSYKLIPIQDTSCKSKRRIKFYAFVLRDFLALFLLIQFVVFLFAFFTQILDNVMATCLPQCQVNSNTTEMDCIACPVIKTVWFPMRMKDHELVVYYICGLVWFFALVGIIGICHRHCCHTQSPHSSSSSDTVLCVDCPGSSSCEGCHYHGGGGGCGGGDGDVPCIVVFVVILGILLLVFAVIGIFVGLVLAMMLLQRSAQRHVHILHRNLIVNDYSVRDLSQWNVDDEDIPYAQVLDDVRGMLVSL